MFRKILDTVNVVALVAILGTLLIGGGTSLGGNYNGSTSHTYSKFDAAGGFSVDGTTVITSSTVATFTGLTVSGPVSGISTSTLSSLNVVNMTSTGNTVISGTLTITGAATTTRTNGNTLYNSTSTGVVIRATNGNCYRLSTDSLVITLATSSCN